MFQTLKNLFRRKRSAKRQRIGFVLPSEQQPPETTPHEKRERWKFVFVILVTMVTVASFVLKVVGVW